MRNGCTYRKERGGAAHILDRKNWGGKNKICGKGKGRSLVFGGEERIPTPLTGVGRFYDILR